MKKLFPIILISIVFYCCKKSSHAQIKPILGTWIFKDTTYTVGFMSEQDNASFECLADSNRKAWIGFTFYTPLLKSGTYAVVNSLDDSTQCLITTGDGINDNYNSTGKIGDTVKTTFAGDTIKISFRNISVQLNSDTQLVSGNLNCTNEFYP
ncbi:MAG TPA: hypothetical protein VKT28_12310 [Puia sp.]|nr:hypothetical protein [Puia sp.]